MSMVMDMINEQHEKELAELKAAYAAEQDILLAENAALEVEVNILRKTIQCFINGEAPTVCDECYEKLYSVCGILTCTSCKRGWDPRENDWTWTKYVDEHHESE